MRKLAVLALLLLFCFPLAAENFIIDSYSVRIDVDESRAMNIKEDLSLEYTSPSHGFYRDIQYRFPGGETADYSLIWTSSEVAEEDNGTYKSIRFGDPDKLLFGGPYEYGIEYDFSLGADDYPDYDEIYYNIVSPGAWDTDIEKLSFSVTLPYPVDQNRIWLTAGPYGSEAELPFTLSDDGCTISGRYSSIPSGYGITLRVEMDEGYFNEAVHHINLKTVGFSLSIAVSLLMVSAVFVIWVLKGRDEKLIYPVRFTPPDGLNPMDSGFVYKGTLDNSAVSAMLIYWADKGVITITDNGGDDFEFTKLRELDDTASDAEIRLFSAFFASGDNVDTKDLRKTGFATKLSGVRKTMDEHFSEERSLSSPESMKLRKLVMSLMIIPIVIHSITSTLFFPGFATIFILIPSMMAYMMLRSASLQIERRMRSDGFRFSIIAGPAVFLLFIWFFIASALVSFGSGEREGFVDSALFIISLFVSMLLAASIDRRSQYADKVLSAVLGYREFMEKVEKDRIEKLSKEDPEFFYHVLSYAMALGVEDEWVKAFSGIYVEPARWYYGRDVADIYVLSSFSRRWGHAYSSTIAPRSSGGGARTSRGSSGFSGGGFSGGGGRSW